MVAYLVVDTKIKNDEAYEEYKIRAKAIVMVASTLLVGEILPHQRMNCGHLLGS